ncbi:single-stranded-DNA-specific exonuclease RecJ [Paenibacillus mendelii]|uniref:Single-stranded-DNA-specific exonuclease RecJ n=1 Tax=Paenibacillus mendelii TaxID=206163 RepID=A0ABV6JB60_9BACL|nr:single-stranded-DNA-specific exonuclease RecJ [Paenibacillus mendelii]MCQ6560900.1 single-stranded-DNA-specific exonuclease RecJ [Paenibacillus mendelii]
MKKGGDAVLIHAKTQWIVASLDPEGEQQAAVLAKKLKLPLLVAKLLIQRGFDQADTAEAFLYGGIEGLHDPFRLKGMKEAVDRINQARERGERVRIYGDYDADGVSSTTLMTCLFRRLEMDFDHYIPHRTLEGYGLNERAIDLASEAGVQLIVTVDTGISAVAQIAYAQSVGIDVIVTDHHEPPAVLPEALALINPKQHDCGYPFKGLAGVGVAFKLAQAILGEPPLEWTDIVALGTIADLMPLQDENRILVQFGLKQLRQTDKYGFRALADVAGIDLQSITSTNIAFGMAPRINAAGRLDHADGAVRLLTASSEDSAIAAAITLDTLNRERQQVVESIVQQAESLWMDKCEEAARAGRPEPSVIVLAGEDWNAGVVGIVASKFIEKLYKPALILGIDPETGMCKGSARSIEGYDLYAALTECHDLLDHYGGHQAAAGMSIHRDNLAAFEQRLGQLADKWLQPEDWIPKTTVDLACGIEDASLKVIEQLSLLEPFGAGNPAPKLLLRDTVVADRRVIGKEGKHLKLSLSAQGKLLDAIGFGYGSLSSRFNDGTAIELVGELSLNEWNGQRKAQFMIQDIRVEHVQLIDRRSDASSLQSLRKLMAEDSLDTAVIVVPDDAWREAVRHDSSISSKLPIYTYGEFEQAGEKECKALLLLGRPPSAVKLSAVIQCCIAIERIYAVYNQAASPDSQMKSGSSGKGKDRSRPVETAWTADFPGREQFAQLYQTLRRVCPLAESGCEERLATMMGWPADTIAFMLKVFHELEFTTVEGDRISLVVSPIKRELTHSATYRNGLRTAEAEQILFGDFTLFVEWIRKQQQLSRSQVEEGAAVS